MPEKLNAAVAVIGIDIRQELKLVLDRVDKPSATYIILFQQSRTCARINNLREAARF